MMNKTMTDAKIAIWGVGFEGEKLYYNLKQKGLDIVSVFDTFKKGKFHNLRIRNEHDIDEINGILILVSTEIYYNEIKIQFCKKGLKEFVDFIPGAMFGKKMALIHANCYGSIIREYLYSSFQFKKEYYIYNIPPIHENKNGRIESNVLKNCTVYIHQNIRADNSYSYYLSDEYIDKQLEAGCVNIVIPNLVGMGKAFFIQAQETNEANRTDLKMPYGMFPYGDEGGDFIRGNETGYSIHEIISGSLYSEKEIKENFDSIFEEFDSKERKWDIRIVDYIKRNYKEKKLFYDINHPTNEVMEKIATRICDLLNIPVEKLFCTMNLGAYEMPIYPEVRLTLGLKYGKASEEIRKESSLKLIEHMDLREYLLEYVFWCVAEEKEKDRAWLGQ